MVASPGRQENMQRQQDSAVPTVSVTIEQAGKLGIMFGEGGSAWPIISSISKSGLVAQFPQISPGMKLLSVADVNATTSMAGLSFKQATVRMLLRCHSKANSILFINLCAAGRLSCYGSASRTDFP